MQIRFLGIVSSSYSLLMIQCVVTRHPSSTWEFGRCKALSPLPIGTSSKQEHSLGREIKIFWTLLHKPKTNTDAEFVSLGSGLAAWLWPYASFMIRNLKSSVLGWWRWSGVAVHDCIAWVTKTCSSSTPPLAFYGNFMLYLLSVREIFPPLLSCCVWNWIWEAFMNTFFDVMRF